MVEVGPHLSHCYEDNRGEILSKYKIQFIKIIYINLKWEKRHDWIFSPVEWAIESTDYLIRLVFCK